MYVVSGIVERLRTSNIPESASEAYVMSIFYFETTYAKLPERVNSAWNKIALTDRFATVKK